jgi:hypothetical protein
LTNSALTGRLSLNRQMSFWSVSGLNLGWHTTLAMGFAARNRT